MANLRSYNAVLATCIVPVMCSPARANGVWLVKHVPPEFIDFSKIEYQVPQSQADIP